MCSVKSDLSDREKDHMHKYFYYDHIDTFMNITKNLSNESMIFQITEPCRASKEALEYRVTTVLGRKYQGYEKHCNHFTKTYIHSINVQIIFSLSSLHDINVFYIYLQIL